jgi:ATP synthase protein I
MFGLAGVSINNTEFSRPEKDPWQEDSDAEFEPLTAAQAKALREQHPALSAGRVVAMQALCALTLAVLAGLFTPWGSSVAYGALAAALPNALLARGLTKAGASHSVLSAVVALLVWEMVKVALTIAILFGAPLLIKDLSWLALLGGLVVTMKIHWLAMAIKPKPGAVEM